MLIIYNIMEMTPLELKDFRTRYELTQAQLAEIASVGIRAVQSWEQGKRKIPQSVIKLLSMYSPELDKPSEIRTESSFEDIIAEKLYKKIKPDLDGLKRQNRDQNELLIGLASVIEELMNKVSDIQSKVKN